MADTYSDMRVKLQEKLAELEDRAQRLDQRLRAPGEADSEENAIFRENDEVLTGLNDLTVHDIHLIKSALSRIEHGTYGTCTHCGKAIAKTRIAALPFTDTCFECAK